MRAVLAAVVITACLAFAGVAGAADPPNAAELEDEIVCPVCKTTLDQSNAEIAQRMKGYIRQRIGEGATEAQIKAELVEQFGRAVLAEPPKKGFDLLAEAMAVGAGVLGAFVLGGLAWTWARRGREETAADAQEPAIDAALEARVDAALRELDD